MKDMIPKNVVIFEDVGMFVDDTVTILSVTAVDKLRFNTPVVKECKTDYDKA